VTKESERVGRARLTNTVGNAAPAFGINDDGGKPISISTSATGIGTTGAPWLAPPVAVKAAVAAAMIWVGDNDMGNIVDRVANNVSRSRARD
jgi:hypothetical protein